MGSTQFGNFLVRNHTFSSSSSSLFSSFFFGLFVSYGLYQFVSGMYANDGYLDVTRSFVETRLSQFAMYVLLIAPDRPASNDPALVKITQP